MKRRTLRVKVYRKSTVPKNVTGKFFDTRPAVWSRRRLCPKCKVRPCVIPALVEHVIFPYGGCHHCICWDPNRHCCWCGVSHHGARIVATYDEFIKRLIELGCKFCQDCKQYVSIPHALHPAINPQPKITNRNREAANVYPVRSAGTRRPGKHPRR